MSNNGQFQPMTFGYFMDRLFSHGMRVLALAGIGLLFQKGDLIWKAMEKFNQSAPKIEEHLNGIDNHMKALDEQGKTFATKEELKTEATRVTNEFRRQLNEQLKKKKLITTPGNHEYDN